MQIHKFPAFYSFIFFALGILLGAKGLYLYSILTGILALLLGIRIRIVLFLLLVPLGALHYFVSIYPARNNITHFKGQEGKYIVIVEEGYLAKVLYLITETDSLKIQGRVYLYRTRTFSPGTILEVQGSFRDPPIFKKFDFPNYLKSLGASGILQVSELKVVKKPENLPQKVRRGLDQKIKKLSLSPLHYALFRAFLLGDRSLVPKEVMQAFRVTGTIHLLAISGLHIVLIFSLFHLTLRILRLSYKKALLPALSLTYFYLFIVGPIPSLIRAVFLITAGVIGELIENKRNPINSLGFAGFITMVLYPYWLFHVGFQLSYLATFGIIYFLPLWKRPRTIPKPIYKFLILPLGISLSAQLFTAPVIIHHFHFVSLVATLANLPLIPLFFLAMAELEAGFIFSLFWQPLAYPFFTLANEAISVMLMIINKLGDLPITYYPIERLSLSMIWVYYLVLLFSPSVAKLVRYVLVKNKNRQDLEDIA